MFSSFTEAFKKSRKGLNVLEHLLDAGTPDDLAPPAMITPPASMATRRKLQEIAVNKISVAVTMSPPSMKTEQIEQALSFKRSYQSGELDFEGYMRAMMHCFPNRMLKLPEELKNHIAACRDASMPPLQ